jgi:signal transduction histidine kinase
MKQENDGQTKERRQRSGKALMRFPSIQTGLSRKFVLAFIALILLMSAGFFLVHHAAMRDTLRREFLHRTKTIAYLLLDTLCQDGKIDSETKYGLAWLEHLFEHEELLFVGVYDNAGRKIFQHFRPGSDQQAGGMQSLAQKPEPSPLNKAATWVTRQVKPFGELHDLSVPVECPPALAKSAASLAGMWRIRFVYGGARLQYENTRRYGILLLMILGFLGLGCLLALFLARLIVGPIQALARLMKTVAQVDMDYDPEGKLIRPRFRRVEDTRFQISTQDEIGQLASEFKNMVKKLETTHDQLEKILQEKIAIAQEKSKLAEDLKQQDQIKEAIIKERTREIVDKNLKLYEISEELQFQKDDLIRMNERLEKISRAKSEFLASMSHELRTPLNSIIGFAEVLKDQMFGEINERQDKYLANVLASGKHLLNLINNILDISKVEAGKMRLILDRFNLNRVVEEVQNIIKTLAYKKNIEIVLVLKEECTIKADVAKVKQILYNLLSNAIKFTEEKGRVEIGLEKVAAGRTFEAGPGASPFAMNNPGVLLWVHDNGVGIPKDEQERIFVAFEQTSRQRHEGTGLGLTLTRKLIHLHGGQIWVQSEPKAGATFFVVLPEETAEAELSEEEGLLS